MGNFLRQNLLHGNTCYVLFYVILPIYMFPLSSHLMLQISSEKGTYDDLSGWGLVSHLSIQKIVVKSVF